MEKCSGPSFFYDHTLCFLCWNYRDLDTLLIPSKSWSRSCNQPIDNRIKGRAHFLWAILTNFHGYLIINLLTFITVAFISDCVLNLKFTEPADRLIRSLVIETWLVEHLGREASSWVTASWGRMASSFLIAQPQAAWQVPMLMSRWRTSRNVSDCGSNAGILIHQTCALTIIPVPSL